MNNLDKMINGVQFTTSYYKTHLPGNPNEAANSYSAFALLKCFYKDKLENQDWFTGYTHNNGIRGNMASLSQNSIKNELLKHEVCFTEYNREKHIAASKYMDTRIMPGMSDYEISAALSNNIERGLIDAAYSYLDDENILKGCISRFVETVNDPERRAAIFSMSAKSKFVRGLIGALDTHYMIYKSNQQDDSSMTGGYGARR